MKKDLYWFTTETGECACLDFYGTQRQAEQYAEKATKIIEEDIYINCGDDIVGVAIY